MCLEKGSDELIVTLYISYTMYLSLSVHNLDDFVDLLLILGIMGGLMYPLLESRDIRWINTPTVGWMKSTKRLDLPLLPRESYF